MGMYWEIYCNILNNALLYMKSLFPFLRMLIRSHAFLLCIAINSNLNLFFYLSHNNKQIRLINTIKQKNEP